MTELPTIVLKPGRERSLLRRHPWVFSGAVAALRGSAEPGATVRIVSAEGTLLAFGAFSPASQIRVRIWEFVGEQRRRRQSEPVPTEAQDEAQNELRIDREFLRERVLAALSLRKALLEPQDLRACRLIHAESDRLPGVVADRYGDLIVLQATSTGAHLHKRLIAEILAELTATPVFERSDGDALELEGLAESSGALVGPEPDAPVLIEERGLRFLVDVRAGQKTGFYLDQRENRALVRRLAGGKDVLDLFSYSGGFSVAASVGGARSVLAVDSSDLALELAEQNLEQNGPSEGVVGRERADAFAWLRRARDSRMSFDLIVLDPPKFAPTSRHVERASRAYKDLNLLALKLLRPGGALLTFSCSSGVTPELFQKIVAGAAADAGIDAGFAARLGAGPDHPVALAFPEGEYLKGLLCIRPRLGEPVRAA